MSERAAPPDQDVRDKALDLSHDVFLAAGAGTGKTTVLVGRYMAALEAGMSPHEIVAVTFTVKAAAEMRKRLREECEKKVAAGDAEEARHWRRIKTQLQTAPINTIHGFCGMLLRESALAGGLDPHYVVLEERPIWLLQRRVVKETLLQRLADGVESATVLVGEYGRHKSEQILQDVLKSRERFARWLDRPPSAEEVLAYWKEIEPELLGQSLNGVLTSQQLREAARILNENPPVTADAKFADERETVLRSLKRASAETEFEDLCTAVADAYAAAAVHKRGGKADDWGGAESFQLVKDALNEVKECLGELGDLTSGVEQDDAVVEAAHKTAAVWQEAAACWAAFQAAKRVRSALDFTDMQLETARLLRENPDVVDKCRKRYKQVMVDEFQDTNDLQREIVWAVSGFDSEKTDRQGPRLFVVGDAKQSIYGFRNADVRIFRKTRKEFREGPASVEELVLKAGFRSTPALGGFHNWLFAHEAVMGTGDKPDYAAKFEPVEAQRSGRDDGLSGEILITDVGIDEVESSGDDDRNAEARREAEAAGIAKRLHEIVESGLTKVGDDGALRPVEYGDIALLFRAMTDINKYERALHRYGIPFYTVAGRGFWQRTEVTDLLNMVRALDNRKDSVALAGVLRSPMFGFDDNELYHVALVGNGREKRTFLERLGALGRGETELPVADTTVAKARWAAEKLTEFRALSGTVALSVLLQRVVDDTGYSAAMAAQLSGERSLANIEKLTDLARGFERDGNYTLGEFVSYVETVSEEADQEGDAPLSRAEADAVQLLTIHKAKGLEWPVVVVPDMGRGSRGSQKALVTSNDYGVCARVGRDGDSSAQCAIGELIRAAEARRDLAEAQRVFYVAATRAQDYLILSAAIDRSDKRSYPAESWLSWLAKACDWDLTKGANQDDITQGSWRMQVAALKPSALPNWSEYRKPVAEMHEAEMLSGRIIGERAAERALQRQVERVDVAPADIEAVTVTSLALYRRCRLAYELEVIKGVPRMDAHWGLGQLKVGAAETVVGTFAHRVLEIIGRRGSEGLDEAMEIANRSPEIGGKLTIGQMRQVRKWVEGYLSTPTYGKISNSAERLRSEVPVSFAIEGVAIAGKVDALAEMGDEQVHLLDYKTGSARAEQGLPAYEFQIGLYCEALRRSRGRLPIEATLVYLSADGPRDVPVQSTVQAAVEETVTLLQELRAGEFAHCTGPWCRSCPARIACQYAPQDDATD
jgi:ATP-dependent helicase/nuclease subunit A